MVKYSMEAENPSKSCKARGSSLRTHFKNTREVGRAVKGMQLKKAQRYLEDVLQFKQAVPFLRFTGGRGRHAQGKLRNAPGNNVGWPVKSTRYVLDLLNNAEANAELKGLDIDALYVTHMQVNKAQQMRRRTYRAHGRIGPYMANPAHIELICSERETGVKKGEVDEDAKSGYSKKRLAQLRFKKLPSGGGVE